MSEFKIGDRVLYPSPFSYNYRQPVPGTVVFIWRGKVEVKPDAGGLTGHYDPSELTHADED